MKIWAGGRVANLGLEILWLGHCEAFPSVLKLLLTKRIETMRLVHAELVYEPLELSDMW